MGESRLDAARDRYFVGRAAEQASFCELISSNRIPVGLLWIAGPGGVGKSTLLRRFARLSRDLGSTVVELDGTRRTTPGGFSVQLALALGLDESADPRATLADEQRRVVLIDSDELQHELESWLRDYLLPSIPDTCLVVTASRRRPGSAWSGDPGLAALTCVMALRNFSPDESRSLLHRRGVASERHESVLNDTHGHPLALNLVADMLSQGVHPSNVSLLNSTEVIAGLLERFSTHLPDEAHRTALYAAAHARVTDESLLGLVVDPTRATELFDWLRSLSFVEPSVDGLHLHDLAATALDADHRRRNPQSYVELHRRIRARIVESLPFATGLAQYRLARELCWMHRFSPVMGRFVDWTGSRGHWPDPVRERDYDPIESAERRFHGDAAALTVKRLLQLTPESFLAIRDSAGTLVGYVCTLRSDSPDSPVAQIDRRVAAAHTHAPLRPGERLSVNCFMDLELGMRPSAIFASAAIQSIRSWVDLERTVLTFEIVPESLLAVWEPMMAYIEHEFRGCTAEVGGEVFRMFGHDWRTSPIGPFLDRMLQRELEGSVLDVSSNSAQLLVLSEQEFGECVRQALKDYTRTDLLAKNPLARCRVVKEAPASPPGLTALQHAISLAAQTLTLTGKDEKLFSALKLTYLDPAPSQEAAAELSGVPFSSFRRHLGKAAGRVVEWLWERELGGYQLLADSDPGDPRGTEFPPWA